MDPRDKDRIPLIASALNPLGKLYEYWYFLPVLISTYPAPARDAESQPPHEPFRLAQELPALPRALPDRPSPP